MKVVALGIVAIHVKKAIPHTHGNSHYCHKARSQNLRSLTCTFTKTLSFVLVSQRMSNCWTLRESLPATLTNGHQMHDSPGGATLENSPRFSTMATVIGGGGKEIFVS